MGERIEAFLVMMTVVAAATERVTELLKRLVPWLGQHLEDEEVPENWRRAAVLGLSALCGTTIAWVQNVTVPGLPGGWPTWIAVGLAASGGAALWNNLLEIVRAIKTARTAMAEEARRNSRKPVEPIPPAARTAEVAHA